MTKIRNFGISKDKTHILVTEAIERSLAGSLDNIKQLDYEVLCIPGSNQYDDKYVLVSGAQKTQVLQQVFKGNKDMLKVFTILDNQEVIGLFQRAKVAHENRQKSGLVNNYHQYLTGKTKQLTKVYNDVVNRR